jgi:hypothetical protein
VTGGYFYLASPYSIYKHGLDAAYQVACEAAGLLMQAGVPVFSPIAHSHGIAAYGGIDPLSHDIWLPADEPFMDAAKGLIVLQEDGWADSYGIAQEMAAFALADKPIHYMRPGVVPAGLI